MANLTQLSGTFTPAFIETVLNQPVYSLTIKQARQLIDMLNKQHDQDQSHTLIQAFGGSATLVESITISAATFITAAVMSFTITFTDTMTVTGTPHLAVVIGSNTRVAAYASGTGTNALVFSYTILSGDAATATHVTVASSALTLNSGTIKDFTGTAATLTLPAVPGLAAVTVN